ncbi:hypothetical protein FJZ17_02385 [Candidatus Pacearchaeota archaeon]|nr:hypothetical protein [Candidatus Pacearchaeota archaeon]
MLNKEFFNPRTLAIVGASSHLEKVGGILMQKAMNSKCKIIPINPGHSELFGIKCFKSILEVKEKIDLAVIAVPRDFVFSSFEECGKKGVKNVIIISAGFSEVGDKVSEFRLNQIAKKYKINFLGPNCFGIFNPKINLDLTFAKTAPQRGHTVFISQSGALWSYLADLDLGFSGFVGLGNMADLEFNDFIEHFSQDKDTKKIILYVEKLKDGKRFIEVCKKAIASGKKIYAVKAGASEQGAKAAFSHTASLASDYEIYKGAFKQAGVIFSQSIEEALNLKKINITKNSNFGKKVIVLTNAGGAGALASDYLALKNYDIILNRDLLGTANSFDYKKALSESYNVDWILIIVTPQKMTDLDNIARVVVEANKVGKKVIPIFLGKESMLEANKIFKNNNLIYFNDFPSFLNSL